MKKFAVLAAAVLALTGCAGANPQVAAYVDQQAINQSEVDKVSKVLADLSEDQTDGPGAFNTAVVSIMIQSRIGMRLAQEKSIQVTQAQRQEFFASSALLTALAANPLTVEFMNGYADVAVIARSPVGSSGLIEQARRTEVRLNPRLGQWDAQSVSVVTDSSGSISSPAPVK